MRSPWFRRFAIATVASIVLSAGSAAAHVWIRYYDHHHPYWQGYLAARNLEEIMLASSLVSAITGLACGAIARRWALLVPGAAAVAVFWLVATGGFLRACGCGSEDPGRTALRFINIAEAGYLSGHGAASGSIRQLIDEGFLDERAVKDEMGFRFDVVVSESNYTATAIPAVSDMDHPYGFYSTNDAVIRYATKEMTQSNPSCRPCYPADRPGQPVQ